VFEIADLQARTLWRYLRESLSFEMASGVIAIRAITIWRAGGTLASSSTWHNIGVVTRLGLSPNGARELLDLGRIDDPDSARSEEALVDIRRCSSPG